MPSYTRTKICGITAPSDALLAAEFGADAIGLVFYEKSSRCVSPEVAREIAFAAGPFITLVGLFVNAAPEEVKEVLQRVPLQLLQFHGNESPEYCEQFGRPYIKALKVAELDSPYPDEAALEHSRRQILEQARAYRNAQGILLDTLSAKGHGGTGESFNWQCVPRDEHINWILAGGLGPDNVGRAVQVARPYAVDVSSGVERSRGLKDAEKMRLFIQAAHAANPDQ
ncbi:phosphoribosylanthranilate isomerase [Gilvimarinus sp. F26214L]|uniref:phosphoribosylanthranilate isomerase n=1 Tax=Gilvimarinus sp. DZF01 TaxID=3461371 RepID=UPI0040458846